LSARRPERPEHGRNRRRDDEHEMTLREEPCGCIRIWCDHGHSPQQILDGLGMGLKVEDLLCEEHRHRKRS
jgi:hypothetical protein